MANVDFTLQDIRNVVREEIDTHVPSIVERVVDERINERVPSIVERIVDERITERVPAIVERIVDERVPGIVGRIVDEHVPGIVERIIDDRVPGIFANEFEKIWEGNLEPAFNNVYRRLDTLEGGMKSVKRVVNQHSAEIMELKAKLA